MPQGHLMHRSGYKKFLYSNKNAIYGGAIQWDWSTIAAMTAGVDRSMLSMVVDGRTAGIMTKCLWRRTYTRFLWVLQMDTTKADIWWDMHCMSLRILSRRFCRGHKSLARNFGIASGLDFLYARSKFMVRCIYQKSYYKLSHVNCMLQLLCLSDEALFE